MADMDDQVEQQAFQQFLQILVLPEIERRQAAGRLPKPVELTKFQIIWFPDQRNTQIRINDEVKARLKTHLRDGVVKKPGEQIRVADIGAIEDIDLTDSDDRDCGHATFVQLGNRWYGSFSAIYNKDMAAKYCRRGEEFLAAAKIILASNLMNAFLDTLFSAVELFAKAKLLLMNEFQMREKSSHKNLHAKFNLHAHGENVSGEQRKAFNMLAHARGPARYMAPGDATAYPVQAKGLVTAVESVRDDVIKLIG